MKVPLLRYFTVYLVEWIEVVGITFITKRSLLFAMFLYFVLDSFLIRVLYLFSVVVFSAFIYLPAGQTKKPIKNVK